MDIQPLRGWVIAEGDLPMGFTHGLEFLHLGLATQHFY